MVYLVMRNYYSLLSLNQFSKWKPADNHPQRTSSHNRPQKCNILTRPDDGSSGHEANSYQGGSMYYLHLTQDGAFPLHSKKIPASGMNAKQV